MREQPWSDDSVEHGRILAVTDNLISQALARLGETVGRDVRVLSDGSALAELQATQLSRPDAVVLCDHDTPDRDRLVHLALTGDAGYVAMLGSRQRAEQTYQALSNTVNAEALAKMHVPAGLDIGGKAPGEIALSVLAEIVAVSYGRSGRARRGS